MTVSQQEGQCMAQWDANRLYRQQRLSLVLDLDHTLVHATSDVRARSYLGHNTNNTNNNTFAAGVRTIRLPLHEGTTDPLQLQQPSNHLHHEQQQWAQHCVKLRPHVNELLRGIESTYEVSVYTAGTKQYYAEEVTMVLCRSLVGSSRDWDDIKRLRYQVQVLQMAQQQQQQQIIINDTSKNDNTNTMDNTKDIEYNKRTNDEITDRQQQHEEEEEEKERNRDINDGDDEYDNDDKAHQPVKKKRKKRSFAPVSTTYRSSSRRIK
ncbi:NLI interacting factor-like phosphatase [Nitzschia inconspicua]|uniref:protein-serine/threonine phosphatase n=1 Tax=Nitzschia inconspicua TaxID=303405 RepID=A0A9K3KS94_9STRA|nr:NLI interacting factor-like phosphatase [Nitzschia inconspicua]